MSGGVPTCCVTGLIAGDPDACADCDPCILGAAQVPDAVKRLIAERGEWADKYDALVAERDALRKYLSEIMRIEQEFRATLPLDWESDPLHDAIEEARAALSPEHKEEGK